MSKMAQGVMALKQWMFPPFVGYKTVELQGALISQSLANLAGLAISSKEKMKLKPQGSVS